MPRRCFVASAQERMRAYPEPGALVEHRRRLLGQARGRVLDLSLRPEPNRTPLAEADVDELTVVAGGPGPSRLWVGAPEASAGTYPSGAVRLMTGPLQPKTFGAASFDTVVSVQTLCTVDHLIAVLRAVAGWLAPAGQLLVLEHVRATGFTGLAQTAFSPFERALIGGCHLDQDIVGGCRQVGLDLTDGSRFRARVAGGVPVPFFSGVARPRARHSAAPHAVAQHAAAHRQTPAVADGSTARTSGRPTEDHETR